VFLTPEPVDEFWDGKTSSLEEDVFLESGRTRNLDISDTEPEDA
jgi:hypothetical protein